MKVCLVPNLTRPGAREVSLEAVTILRASGVEVLAAEEIKGTLEQDTLVRFLPKHMALAACDIVLTVGGDGTLLHAAGDTLLLRKPLLGINTGRLGFLSVIERDELDKLTRLARGDYTLENRSVLKVGCEGDAYTAYALNDVVLFKQSPESTIELDILCDDVPVSSIRGDGVVFATPTGSTAYSMSAGGPIVDALLGGIVVTGICAHVLQMPPMVFAGSRMLRVLPQNPQQSILVTTDGLPATALPSGVALWIRQSAHSVPLVQFTDSDQLMAIDKKLKGR